MHMIEVWLPFKNSTLTWEIFKNHGEPGGLPSMGSHRVEHN